MTLLDRITAGEPHARAAPEQLGAMAARLCAHARGLGFRIIALTSSRTRHSGSRILTLADPVGRAWLIRVGAGPCPERSGNEEPHLDFVCRDGVSGFPRAAGFLDRIASGEVEWRKPRMRKGLR